MAIDERTATGDLVTELTTPGANCPFCINEALDALRRVDGVLSIRSSMRGQCIRVVHRAEVDVADVVAILRRRVFGVELCSNEWQMAAIEPERTPRPCGRT
jgi:copper chaperone CopZ